MRDPAPQTRTPQTYLVDEIRQRVGGAPVAFKLHAQGAEAGDQTEDPWMAYPVSFARRSQ